MFSRQQRNSKSQPGNKVELQFINVVPNDQNQNAETRSIIRANAAHFHWRHNRPPREGCKPHKKSIQVAPTLGSSCARPTGGIGDGQSRHGTDSQQSSIPSQTEHGELNSQEWMSSRSLLTLTNNQLGLEEVDPFSTFECDLPREFVSRCITFSQH